MLDQFSGMRIAGLPLKMWSIQRCLMCFRVVSKVGGVIVLRLALLAGIGVFFSGMEIQAQNAVSASHGTPSGLRALTGHVPSATARLTPVSEAPGDQRLALAISLPLRDAGRLEQLLREIYDPASTNYH